VLLTNDYIIKAMVAVAGDLGHPKNNWRL